MCSRDQELSIWGCGIGGLEEVFTVPCWSASVTSSSHKVAREGNGGAVAFANAFALGCGRKLQTIILDETWRVSCITAADAMHHFVLIRTRTMTLVLQASRRVCSYERWQPERLAPPVRCNRTGRWPSKLPRVEGQGSRPAFA